MDEFCRWLRGFGPDLNSAPRLLCFPHAGGSASAYAPVARELAPLIEALAVQYPGRQDRRTEPRIEGIHELADRITDSIKDRIDDRPYAFWGHSMGAILAFEVARRRAAAGASQPVQLLVSGRRAPSLVRTERVHLRDDDGLIDELRLLGGTDPRIFAEPELIAAILPVMRSDYTAIETYRYRTGPPLRCPITALAGDADPKAAVAEVAAWREHTRGDFALEIFPGGHFFIDAARGRVVTLIRSLLAEQLV